MAEKFELLEQQLELFIENTRQMGIIVSDFQPQGQNVLNQKMYVFLSSYTFYHIILMNYILYLQFSKIIVRK